MLPARNGQIWRYTCGIDPKRKVVKGENDDINGVDKTRKLIEESRRAREKLKLIRKQLDDLFEKFPQVIKDSFKKK